MVQAGYQVIALDAFADADTQQLALQSHVLPYQQHGFEAQAVLQCITSLRQQYPQLSGLLYGAGLEAQPALLQAIAQQLPLLGNTAEQMASIHAYDFFSQLTALNIAYPPTSQALQSGTQVLVKHLHGSGGSHIRWAQPDESLKPAEYSQRYLSGDCIGLLFVADGRDCQSIGLHQQWPVAPDNLLASRMLSHVEIAPVLQQQILQMAQQLTRHYQLRGLNSLDVLIQHTEQDALYCLELNPRLSASIDLYQTTPPLMQLHFQGLQGKLPKQLKVAPQARGRSIIYAQQRLQMGALQWPSWVSDIPLAGSQIQVGQPVCTVHAQHEQAASCWQMLEQRVQSLSEWLLLQHQ